ncbi:MAG: cobyrinic acid a,c-diamide synthase [Leifsonia xyli]|nr:MAG: cobyrinic acid a,c-diamide synthase [Leifsonia xyli]
MTRQAPGLVISAPRSGSGKTTVALGVMRALRRRGLDVGSAKCGPDYIDTAFHAAATGRAGVNLDAWAMPPALLAALAAKAAEDRDLLIAEGAMGLFDGAPSAHGGKGSTADVCAVTGWPVLLVLDVSAQAQSAAAVALGLAKFDERIRTAGVILNRVASHRHGELCATAITSVGLPVVGMLPRRDDLRLPERHLGLVQACETDDVEDRLDALGAFIEQHVDLSEILRLASVGTAISPAAPIAIRPPGRRVAIASDAAFSFFYPHLDSAWRAAGAEIIGFSPLADEPPPEQCDACWLPGGYPELHAHRLAAATRFKSGLQRFAQRAPVHGECGGFMALGRSLIDTSGRRHEMAGLLDVVTSFETRRMTLGYRSVELQADGPLGQAGDVLAGHEFHYATVVDEGEDPPFAMASDTHSSGAWPIGARRGLVSGSFFHVIAGSPPPGSAS